MSEAKPGRNDQCPCGSGRKYKQCCLAKDEEAARQARAALAAEAAAQAETEAEPAAGQPAAKKPTHAGHEPWRRDSAINTHGFRTASGARKIGSG